MSEKLSNKRLAAIQKRIDQHQVLFNFIRDHPELPCQASLSREYVVKSVESLRRSRRYQDATTPGIVSLYEMAGNALIDSEIIAWNARLSRRSWVRSYGPWHAR